MAGKSNFGAMLLGGKAKPDAGPPAYGGGETPGEEMAEGDGSMCSCPSCGAPIKLMAGEMVDPMADAGGEMPPMGDQAA